MRININADAPSSDIEPSVNRARALAGRAFGLVLPAYRRMIPFDSATKYTISGGAPLAA